MSAASIKGGFCIGAFLHKIPFYFLTSADRKLNNMDAAIPHILITQIMTLGNFEGLKLVLFVLQDPWCVLTLTLMLKLTRVT